MTYAIRSLGNITLVELSGATWGTLQDLQLKAEISAAVAMGRRRFILDFTKVGAVTSMGLGVVVACWASIRQAGGALLVCGINPRIRSLMDVTGVGGVLNPRTDLQDALAAFAST